MNHPYKQAKRGAETAVAEDGRWLFCEPALVADIDDPEKQHRVRAIIPAIDEDLIYDEWIRPAAFCLGDGFGSVFIPPVGSEILVTGTLGQKFNLSYFSTYNEEIMMPSELNKDICGIKVPKDFQLIAQMVMKLLAKEIHVIAEQLAELKGRNVTIEAAQVTEIKGVQIKLSGTTINISGSGNVTINGATVNITSTGVLKLEGRVVSKVGPAI